MAVPTRVEAASLLLSLEPPPWHLRHSRAVAEVAAFLAARVAERERDRRRGGLPADPAERIEPLDGIERLRGADRRDRVDVRAVEVAALLHDVDKALPVDDPARRLRHGEGSAAWLRRIGHPELGPLVAAHPVTRLVDAAWFHDALMAAPIEVRIVAYADKRAGQRLEPMADRFASWERRYPVRGPDADTPRAAASSGHGEAWNRATLDAVRERARELEASVCAAAGTRPDEVGRLRWTGSALARASVVPSSSTVRTPVPSR